MEGKSVVLCAGSPGSGRDEYIRKMLEIQDAAKEIKYYHLFDYLLQKCRDEGYKLNKETILDFVVNNPREIDRIRELAIAEICDKMGEAELHLISTPYSFEWDGKLIHGLTENDIAKLNPSKFIVIIDDVLRVRERLKQDPQWEAKDFTLVELAKWRRTEIDGIRTLAHSLNPPREFYIIAVEHDPKVLYDLITNETKKKIYLSYPITGVASEEIEKTLEFAKQLEDLYIVFNPLTINEWAIVESWKEARDEARDESRPMPDSIECTINYKTGEKKFRCNAEEIRHAIKDIRHQIVDRDYMIIDTSDYVVVYHQRKEISAGVVCEMVHGKAYGKYVYAMYPYEPSPFLEYYSSRIFENAEKFLGFLRSAAK